MERYRRIRRYGVDEKFMITFQNENGENFYINGMFKFIPITENTSLEEIRTNAKWYSQQGAKLITTKLWKNSELRIKKSKYCTLKYLEETYKIYKVYDIRC